MTFRDGARLDTPPLAAASRQKVDDVALTARIITAYQRAQRFEDDPKSFWANHLGGRKASIHDALMRGDVDEVGSLLREPTRNEWLYGFDGIQPQPISLDEQLRDDANARSLYDHLLRLAEAVGAWRLYHPGAAEGWQQPPGVDGILSRIEARLGAAIVFPNPYPDEIGLRSDRGIVSWRPIQAIYQAALVRRHVPLTSSGSVLEIGAGLGRTAFYATTFGVARYTIVDIPITCAAQAYFLGRTLGPGAISLFGEPEGAPIRILPTDAIYETSNMFDLVLNADSFTELSRESVERYMFEASRRAPLLISINHEANPFTVAEILAEFPDWQVDRRKYWLRPSYVEELVRFARAR